MALILCPECHNQISDKAEQCPYCGLPAKYFLQEPSVKQDMTALLKEKYLLYDCAQFEGIRLRQCNYNQYV